MKTEVSHLEDELSALIDGELSAEQAHAALDRLLADPEAGSRWLAYHAQSDAMRFPSPSALRDAAFLEGFERRFASEPVHLPVQRDHGPGRRMRGARQWRRTWLRYGMPGAAAAAAVAVVTWMTYPHTGGRGADAGIVAIENNRAGADVSTLQQDYLLAHQQFAPSSRFHGVAPYVRTVSVNVPAPADDARVRR